MGKTNFSDEFKRSAVRQITERGYHVSEVLQRLGVSQHSFYEWKKKLSSSENMSSDRTEETRRSKKELARYRICQGWKVKYAFIAEHRPQFSVRTMCRCLRVHFSRYFAWLKNPLSSRALDHKRHLLQQLGGEQPSGNYSEA